MLLVIWVHHLSTCINCPFYQPYRIHCSISVGQHLIIKSAIIEQYKITWTTEFSVATMAVPYFRSFKNFHKWNTGKTTCTRDAAASLHKTFITHHKIYIYISGLNTYIFLDFFFNAEIREGKQIHLRRSECCERERGSIRSIEKKKREH